MPQPTTEDWIQIAEGFRERWDFPNCLGAIDGKHVVIQAPPNSGSWFYNYKGSFSIVLLAVVDAYYRFRVIDVGGYGRGNDAGILEHSRFGEGLRDGSLAFPEDAVVPGAEHRGKLPFVLVGDEAFPLRRNLMRPFPGTYISPENRIYNYRLSRARMMVECTFGILSSQWRMYRRPITMSPFKAELCVKATCVLNNFLRESMLRGDCQTSHDGEACALRRFEGTTAATGGEPSSTREAFRAYFNEEGAVGWQQYMI